MKLVEETEAVQPVLAARVSVMVTPLLVLAAG